MLGTQYTNPQGMASAGMESLRFPQQLSIHNKSAYIEKTLASNATKYLLTHVHQTWNSGGYFYRVDCLSDCIVVSGFSCSTK
jgi:hypothetical protein